MRGQASEVTLLGEELGFSISTQGTTANNNEDKDKAGCLTPCKALS